jgi:uncharacterized protein YjbI with pentapeptide repeats
VPRRSTPLEPSPPELAEEAQRAGALPEDLIDLELEERTFAGGDAAGRDASGVTLLGCRLEDVELSGSVLRRASLRDVLVTSGSWANVAAPEARLTRVELRSVRATGAAFAGARFTDVTFADCRLDLSSFRFASMERVRFARCRLEEADLAGCRGADVVFDSCDLSRASLAEATFERSEMRGCALDAIGNPERLRGVAMPWNDVLLNAATLAAGVGVRVLDE